MGWWVTGDRPERQVDHALGKRLNPQLASAGIAGREAVCVCVQGAMQVRLN